MEMVEVKTADLIGPALDWAVAKAEDTKIDDSRGKELRIDVGAGFQSPWMPSVNWHQGGPLIEKHGICVIKYMDTVCDPCKPWTATMRDDDNYVDDCESPLIAACLAIVAAKLGDTVSVPKELMQ